MLPFRWFAIDEIDDASQDMIIGDRDDDDDDENYNDKNDDHDDEIDEDDDSWAFKAMQHRWVHGNGGFFVKCQGQTFRRVSLMRDVEDDGDHDGDDDDIFSNVNVKPQWGSWVFRAS